MDNLSNATGESAAETETLTADSTPETVAEATTAATDTETDPETVPDTDENGEDAEQGADGDGAQAADAADATESATKPDDDPFADLESEARWFTDEQIKEFRLPKAARAKFTEIQKQARDANERIEKAGGELALQALTPFGSILGKPSATPEELDTVIEAIAEANPLVGGQFVEGAVMSLLNMPEWADSFFQRRFGSKHATLTNFESVVKLMGEYDAGIDKVSELLKLDKAGVLDTDYARTQFGEQFGESDLYNEMRARQRELEAQVTELKNRRPEPEQQADAFTSRATADFDTDFGVAVAEAVEGIVSRVHWGKGPLTDLVRSVVTQQLKESENYRDAVEFIRSTGKYKDAGNKPSFMAQTKLHLLKNAAQARALEQVRKIQSDLKAISENSVRAARDVKKQEAAAKAVEEPKKPATLPIQPKSLEEQLRENRERFSKAFAAEQSAGSSLGQV